MPTIIALDFETADKGRDSACALGAARVETGPEPGSEARIIDQALWLIRPPRAKIDFTHIHGLTWADLKHQPSFKEVFQDLLGFSEGADLFAAHNAGFDRSVLSGGCENSGLLMPTLPWLCTVRLARACWQIRPTRLPDVCRWLGIPLRHHDAASDSAACGQIVADAWSDGFDLDPGLLASAS